jgi:Tfp pilus assembly protein PilO
VKIAPREMVLGLATVAVALFAVTLMVAKPRIQKWKSLGEQQKEVKVQIDRARKLIADKQKWEKQYKEMSKLMPTLPAAKNPDAYWLEIMDNIAAKNGVKISKRQAGEEKKQGDIYELPVECKEWEGTLDATVHFLFDMQSEGAMLDIRQLLVKPQGKGILRGRFTLYCAYMREVQKGR